MMLRESVQQKNPDQNLKAVTGQGDPLEMGVSHADLLIEFAESAITDDKARLIAARTAVVDDMGEAAMVDSAGVAAFFNGIDRIADATGTQMDAAWEDSTADLRDELGISDYAETKKRLETDGLNRLGILRLV